jgi:hypothetical protein
VADAGQKFMGGQKNHIKSRFSSSPSLPTAGDKSYRCDERYLACRVDRRHDKNRIGDGGTRKGQSRVASHREWVGDRKRATSRLV